MGDALDRRYWRAVKYARPGRALPRHNRWNLTLECGHRATRVRPVGAASPRRVACDDCRVQKVAA